MATDNAKKNIHKHASILEEFVTKDFGCFLFFTQDPLFRNFRNSLHRDMNIKTPCANNFQTDKSLLSAIKERSRSQNGVIVVVERFFKGALQDEFIRNLCSFYQDDPNVSVIAIADGLTVPEIKLWHEQGVDNIMTGALSTDALINKIAQTIRPADRILRLRKRIKILCSSGRYDEALTLTPEIFLLKEDGVSGWLAKGDIFMAQGNSSKAVECYEKAYERAMLTDNQLAFAEPSRKISEIRLASGMHVEALRHLEALNEFSPLNIARKHDMKQSYVEIGQIKKSLSMVREIIATTKIVDKGSEELVRRELANFVLKECPDITAEEFAMFVGTEESSRHQALQANNKAVEMAKNGYFKEAIDLYQQAIELDPGSSTFNYNLARALSRANKYYELRHAVVRIKTQFPSFGEDYTDDKTRVDVYLSMGKMFYQIYNYYDDSLIPPKKEEESRKEQGVEAKKEHVAPKRNFLEYAKDYFIKVQRIEPNNRDAIHLIGEIKNDQTIDATDVK